MKSRLLLPLLLPILLGVLTPSVTAQNLTAADILAKHIEAVGKSRVSIGTVQKENEPAAKMAIVSEVPNRVSAIYVFEKYDFQMSYDGKNSIVRPLALRMYNSFISKYQQMLASGLMFNSISLYNILEYGQDLKFEAKGTKKVHDRPAYVVETKTGNGLSARLFFDAETFMWVRTEYGKVTVQHPMGQFTNDVVNRGQDDISADFYFEASDFRDVDGVKLPFKFEHALTAPYMVQKPVGGVLGTISE